ncbi:MAG TPA: hypothetical protein ENN01_00850 [Halothiobacillus sp.]|nr:hypothetical protein [Halothiobacillus sp.]
MQLYPTLIYQRRDYAERLRMPEDAYPWFYEGAGYGRLLQPQAGDDCGLCFCGDAPYPPVRAAAGSRAGSKGCCQ